jgi:hypothetical protein
MIHMGRAWLPATYEPGERFWMTAAADYSQWSSASRKQVWCRVLT